MPNALYYGDNLQILREYISDESVDLVYLDPPFKSGQDYNVLFEEKDGSQSAAQIQAFEDTWSWDQAAAAAYEEIVEKGPERVSQTMQAFRLAIGENDMLAYLSMMAPRLIELRRVLKPTGSIYLHCDPTASHYLKLLMDSIFGPQNYRNEIIWRRTGSHNSAKRYGPIHDVLLFFSRSDKYKWNRVYRSYSRQYIESFFNKSDGRGRYRSQTLTGSGVRSGKSGEPWNDHDVTAKGRHWAFPGALGRELKIEHLSLHEKLDTLLGEGLIAPKEVDGLPEYRQYLDTSQGVPLQDIWAYQPHTQGVLYGTDDPIDTDVRWLDKRGGAERLGYPTQKPEGLLKRILESSSDEGDVVLDPFCGCGTTIAVAQKLNRQWIGIDITCLATGLIKTRLKDTFGDDAHYEVIGEPVALEGAKALAKDDPYQFQWWALWQAGARPAEMKKGADKGIDGRLYFHDDPKERKAKQIIISVKSGKIQVSHLRDLRGVLDREKAEIGVLITLNKPTKHMKEEAASAGFYTAMFDEKFPRIQILTIEELLAGKKIEYPSKLERNVTLKKAPKAKKKTSEQKKLGLEE